MSSLLMLSIALVIGSLIGSIVLWVQSGETRIGLFGGLFLLFATHQGIELWSHWGAPFAIDASTATAIAGVLGVPLSMVSVIQATTGGGFGGKEDTPSEFYTRAALLAHATRRPVKLLLDREWPAPSRYALVRTDDGPLVIVKDFTSRKQS